MIARDNYTLGKIEPGTSLTFSHTTAGINRLLLVFFTIYNSTSDVVSGVTYNGVALTRINYAPYPGTSPRQMYCYALNGPASGANNVVISLSASNYVNAVAVSYTGVKNELPSLTQEKHTANNSSPMTLAVNSVDDNSWGAAMFHGEGTNVSPSTGSTFVTQNTDYVCDFAEYSSNPKTPAGSISMAYNVAVANNWPSLGILVVFAPAPPAVKDKFFLMF